MKTSLVLTCIGPDRPGLVEALARVVAEHEGNWVESRMAHLAGQFAGILRIELPSGRAEALQAALGAGSLEGLGVTVAESDSPPAAGPGVRSLNLSLVGRDHPGIVRDISRVLAAHAVNVEELETSRSSAPQTGEPLFRARATLDLPTSVTAETLRERLEEIAGDLMVDVDLENPD